MSLIYSCTGVSRSLMSSDNKSDNKKALTKS
nr:MAG TPA: hypothetical protein [Caudoviricetes sp.]DAZ44713.1 MAG TPA: hypothetical protein [Caudoviricetes sp.]